MSPWQARNNRDYKSYLPKRFQILRGFSCNEETKFLTSPNNCLLKDIVQLFDVRYDHYI